MKLISWNVNGIRAILKKNFYSFLKKENPDVICVQETKAHPDQVDHTLDKQYKHHFWNAAEKKGYSGTAIFSKIKPEAVHYGMSMKEHDKEGRVITIKFPKFYLVNVYTPNAKPDLSRLKYRQKWDKAFLNIQGLDKRKPVIVTGDLNVAHEEIDIARPKNNKMSPGFTKEEREDFSEYIENNFIDTFRKLYPDKVQYSWWTYRFGARKRNVGWRIDYFLTSKRLKFKKAYILDKILGSDHCPIGLEL